MWSRVRISVTPLSKRAVDRTRNQHVTRLARQMAYVRTQVRPRARTRPERWHQHRTRSSQELGTASAGDTACAAEFSVESPYSVDRWGMTAPGLPVPRYVGKHCTEPLNSLSVSVAKDGWGYTPGVLPNGGLLSLIDSGRQPKVHIYIMRKLGI
jgi:hypothetical protein